MSCNGCRVLRKGCSESCILRPCLQWIGTPEAQGHATVFVAKFFGRAGLMSFISGVAEDERPALFQSLLFEACGRTVNPVNGAVGLVGSGNWSVCQAAVETVLRGGILSPAAAAAVETSNCYLGGSTIRTTQDPSSTSLNNNNNRIIKRRREAQAQIHDDDDDTSSHLLHLSLSSGPRSPLKKRWGNPAAALVYSEEESSMTSMESGCTATATGGYTAPHTAEKKLLNLFV